jgi:phenylacetate-CoA ligase
LISESFNCPVTDQYGFSEGCGNASRCQEDVFHEDFEYGILECVDPEWIGDDLKRGRIVATGFASYGMPFIRYDVGDIGIWRTSECSCGRASDVLLQIEGRVEDYVITPEGRKIRRFDYIFKDTHSVKEAQVVQREKGSICIRVVRRPGYSSADETMIRDEIGKMISPQLEVTFEYVKEIPRESNGKFRAVKSLIGD